MGEMGDMQKSQAPGERALKVASIFLIVFGGIALSFWVVWFFVMFIGQMEFIIYFAFFFTVVALHFATQAFAGIIGIKNCNNIAKARQLRVVGVIVLATTLIYSISLTFAESVSFLLSTAVVSLIFPIIYIYGAYKNLKAKIAQAE